MQRSRRALLQRRALEHTTGGKNRLYKVSLSLVFVLWGLVFLVSLWTSRGYGYRDGSGPYLVGMSTWEDTKVALDKGSDSFGRNYLPETDSRVSHESLCKNDTEAKISSKLGGREGSPKYMSHVEVPSDRMNSGFVANPEKEVSSSDRLANVVPLSLDEFKSKVYNSRSKSVAEQVGGVKHRVEPGGAEYNYASSSNGAKVLAYNKEAKGAFSILCKDMDKYLRNPCSTEEKYVVIELSEEILVDTIEMANFEHYSSTLKDFELLGSLVYPAERWAQLGNFTAANAKHAQRFALQEPKWVRYLKLNLLSHHGSEFYCTLSVFEVYGMDVVERMLEDLISIPDNLFLSQGMAGEQMPSPSQPEESTKNNNVLQNSFDKLEPDSALRSSNRKGKVAKKSMLEPIEEKESRHLQTGRMPGDGVLKILMQKVRSLDLNLSVLGRYLEDLNFKYGSIFRGLDKEIENKDLLLENIKSDLKNFIDSKEVLAKNVDELVSWKSLVSVRLDNLIRDNAVLRLEVQKVLKNQIDMESKSRAVFLVSLILGLIAIVRLFIDMLWSVYSSSKSGKFCGTCCSLWNVVLLSCTIVIVILSL